MKTARMVLVCSVLLALCSAAFAAEFWVVREKSGKCVVVKKKPADVSLIFKGPFAVRKEAAIVVKECRPRARVTVGYWVVREPSGVLVVVDHKPSDPAVIVKGPFRERKQAEVVIKKSSRGGTARPERAPAEQLKVAPKSAPTERAMPKKHPVESPTAVPGAPQGPASQGATGREQEREPK